ncbi:stage III sporulation protein AF [Clostridium sp.]|uniref:stage III sporulation protein AF n=1 Tax=Clostridium sp. TaxID=1506 RepID=UPI003F2D5D31
MEILKGFITTLVSMLLLMTAIELVAPESSIKKYLKFVLGLILISVMLNPIVAIFSKDESEIVSNISKYQDDYIAVINEEKENTVDIKKEKVFKDNLDKNCQKILEEKFKDMEFASDISCSINLESMNYSIDNVSIGVKEKGIKKIQKIQIGDDTSEVMASEEEIQSEAEIISYLEETLNLPKDKIEVYSLE